jgi:twitching motility protein PilT
VRHEVAGRVRMTFYKRNGGAEMSCRFCGSRIPAREELGLPARVDELARKPNGLVLITGPTGAGKTTTLNYMVDLINAERRCKILTIEDPIEFVHENRRAIVVQQEVLTDVRSFNRALIHALRQDPKNEDARTNLAYAMRQKKQGEKNESSPKNQDSKQDKQDQQSH